MPNPQGPTVKIKRESKSSLERIAREIKAQQIDVLAWAVGALLDYYEHHGKRLILPLKFTETFKIYSLPDPQGLVLEQPPASPASNSSARKDKKNKQAH